MNFPRTFKQDRAMNINWSKARLMSSNAAVTNALDTLNKYKVLDSELEFNLIRARIAITTCLQIWDKQIWEKLNDK